MAYASVDDRRAACKRHYNENKNAYLAKNQRRKVEMRAIVAAYKAGKHCKNCPEDNPRCLDFHHMDPKTKETCIALVAHRGWGLKRVMAEIAKCVLICSNCHRKEHLPS
jgi:hypothetical protein